MASSRPFPLKNLLLIGLLLPVLSGLFYGGWVKAYLLMGTIIVAGMIWRRLRLPNFILIGAMSLGLLTVVDLGWNLIAGAKPQTSLFQPTEIPFVQTYLPLLDTTVSPLNCQQNPVPMYGDSCREFVFSTDENGFRRSQKVSFGPVSASRKTDSLDVLFLGDSFGVGMSGDAQTIPSYLARMGFSTVNLSVSGHGPWEEWQLLQKFGEEYPVREGGTLIWQLFEANDLDGPFGQSAEAPPLPNFASRYRMFRLHSPLRNLLIRTLSPILGTSPYPGTELRASKEGVEWVWIPAFEERAALTEAEWQEHRNWERFREVLHLGITWAKERKLKVLLLNIPPKESVLGPWMEDSFEATGAFDRLLRDLAAQEEVDFLPLFDPLSRLVWKAENSSAPQVYWKADIHLTPAGNEFAGETIRQFLPELPLMVADSLAPARAKP